MYISKNKPKESCDKEIANNIIKIIESLLIKSKDSSFDHIILLHVTLKITLDVFHCQYS